jgi:molybdopterin converting factor small subunit
MADATSEAVTLELHGFLAQRLASLGRPRGTRRLVEVPAARGESVGSLLARLADSDERYTLLYDVSAERLPEHVEAVLNDRVLDLQGGLDARLTPGDVLSFLPAHAGGGLMGAAGGDARGRRVRNDFPHAGQARRGAAGRSTAGRRLREQLEADPEWEDGAILYGV